MIDDLESLDQIFSRLRRIQEKAAEAGNIPLITCIQDARLGVSKARLLVSGIKVQGVSP